MATFSVHHTEGWESPVYAAEFQHTDELLGKLIARLTAAKMFDSTVVFIGADHGGVGSVTAVTP